MFSYIICIGIIIFLCIYYSFYKYQQIINTNKYTANDIMSILGMFMDKSYETIYNSDLIHYIVNNDKPNVQQQETIERNYIKTCFMFMGKNNKKMFIKFFGDEETLIINIICYMRKKYNDDGLTKIIDQQTQENS